MARTNMRTTKRAPKDTGRRVKKKPCQLCKDRVEWVDYKNSGMLKRYMSERGKIRARRVSGNCEQHQREIAEAIKTARELALLPYTQRTVTERRGGGGRGRDRDGGGRGRAPRSDEETTLASGPEDERPMDSSVEAPPVKPTEAAAPVAPAPEVPADAPAEATADAEVGAG
jgi:small subunit ribosomal protein S18